MAVKAKMTRFFEVALAAAGFLLLVLPTAQAGWGVGNGGDEIRLAFANARDHAAQMALRIQARSLALSLDPTLRQWIIDNHADLSADIAKTQHVWIQDAEPNCALTQLTPAADIQFSYPTCDAQVGGFDGATQLMIHESVHHFGVSDEEFADGVALAIFGAWQAGLTDWVPATAGVQRSLHSAVWTGSAMVVYGGLDLNGVPLATGGVYDPVADAWTALPAGGPARYNHQAVWTGTQMIVWGGYVIKGSDPASASKVWENNGAIWDAAANTWTPLATPYGPTELADLAIDERVIQTAVWTGKEMLVFGGALVNGALTGGAYNPATKTWRALTAVGAPVRVEGHSAVWADTRMIIWGGLDTNRNKTNTGASYDPVADLWTALPTAGAPAVRDGHTAIWTGTQMIVFAGFDPATDPSGTGGIYDLPSNSWTALKTESVQARLGHTAVWTGSEMLVYAGKSKRFQTSVFGAVSAFNPTAQTWRIVDSVAAPVGRALHSAVWTGSTMLIFGGKGDGGAALGTTGVFLP